MIYTTANTSELGRPAKVFVNGNEVDLAISADTDKGEVIYVPQPVRAKKNSDFVYSRQLRGKVTVEFIAKDR